MNKKHLEKVLAASDAAIQITELLPSSDSVRDLKNVLFVQKHILAHMLEEKDYGQKHLDLFGDYIDGLKDQVESLKSGETCIA